jgi:hypothetical protein
MGQGHTCRRGNSSGPRCKTTWSSNLVPRQPLKTPNTAIQSEERSKLRPIWVSWITRHWGGAERGLSKEENGDQSPEMTRTKL